LIHVSTVRKNIEYSVIDGLAEMSKRIECLAELVGSTLRDEIQPDGKVVVMYKSKPEISAIVEAGLFPYKPFYADITEERKEEVLEEFRTSQIQVVVASGSFNIGIDIAGIRLIVHIDEPRNIRDYGQGSGRVGRDGSASCAIIIRGGLGLGDDRVKQYIDREHR
jgi:superfamily II DNA helicase RecQ